MRFALVCLVALLSLAGCSKKETPVAGQARATSAKQTLDEAGNPRPSPEDRCAMCGMKVVEHRQWVGAIEIDDGATHYFCGVRCTLASALHSDRFLGVAPARVRRIRVPEYLHPERSIDGDRALFVVGSDVRGPMGVELVPAATQEDADTILRRHGGRIVRRADVNDRLLSDLKRSSMAAP